MHVHVCTQNGTLCDVGDDTEGYDPVLAEAMIRNAVAGLRQTQAAELDAEEAWLKTFPLPVDTD